MPIPQLSGKNKGSGLVQQNSQLNTNYVVPNPGRAYMQAQQGKNYLLDQQIKREQLADIPAERRIRDLKVQNYLESQKALVEEQGWKRDKEKAEKASKDAENYLKVIRAPTPEAMKRLADILGIEGKVERIGPNTKITTRDGIMYEGPSVAVENLLGMTAKDPSWFTDEPVNIPGVPGTKRDHLAAITASLGISATKGKESGRAYKIGEIKEFKEGDQVVTKEWTGSEWKTKATGRRFKEPEPKEPQEVTWTTATNNLSKRFGKQDAIGNIIITLDLQHRHRLAQKKLVELKRQGIEPLDAINQAEDFANKVEENYSLYLKAAKTEEQKKQVGDQFKAKYGYLPR